MQDQPIEISFKILGESLALRDILALSSTNQNFYDLLVNPEASRKLAITYGFPFGLTLTELKSYESMSLDDRLIGAAKVGDFRIVSYMVEHGAKAYNKALDAAASTPGGDADIAKLMMDLGATNVRLSISKAAKVCNTEMVEVLIPYAEDFAQWLMRVAARNGCLDIIELTEKYGARDYNSALLEAAESGQVGAVELLISKGAGNLEDPLIEAVTNNYLDVVKILLDSGADNYDEILRIAFYRTGPNSDVYKLIKSYM